MLGPRVLSFPDRRRSVPLLPPGSAVAPQPTDASEGGRANSAVREELAGLPRGWHVAHGVTDGDHLLFDHVVVGRAGVFVLLTERHRGGHATVYQHMLYVDGHPHPVISTARSRAHLAATTLSAACGQPVDVQSLIVLVDLERVDVQRQPRRPVHVLARHQLADWLVHRPEHWAEQTVAEVFARARDHLTWRV